MFVIVFQMIGLLLLNIARDIFCDVADINGAVDILFQQNGLRASEVLHLQTILKGLVRSFYFPVQVVNYADIGIWNIEVYFKTCKQYLKYCKECQSTSFDSLTAHLAIANVRYMMLSVFQRANTDYRSLGELFYMYVQEVAEITFDHSMKLIMIALLTTVKEFFALTEKQMTEFVQQFISNPPAYLRAPLEACAEQLSAA